MGKRNVIFALVLIVSLGGIALVLRSHAKNRFSTFQQLPDGSFLRLGRVEFSKGSHTYRTKAVTGWKAKVAGFLPEDWKARLGWMTLGGTMIMGGNGTNLCVFTLHEGPVNSKGFDNVRLVLFDELGNSFDVGGDGGAMYTSDARHQLRVDCRCPPAFPRRGRMLGLRYLQQSNGGWERIAQFTTANPAAGDYPIWTPEPLPATKTDGDLSVTLVNFKSGLSKKGSEKPTANNEIAVTEAAFRMAQSGSETDAWRPISVEISDATGNDWLPRPYTVSSRHEQGMDLFSFDGALWPGETAWKIRFEFSRIADFAPDEIFDFKNIPVPGATQVINLDNAAELVHLIAISGPKAQQPGSLKWGTKEKCTNISIGIGPISGHRLTLLKVTDEANRVVEFENPYSTDAEEQVYGLKVPDGAKQLNFTFALHQSRFVEFLAKPEFVRTN